MKIKPLNGSIVVKIEEDRVTKGGIIIPDNANPNDQIRVCRVKAVYDPIEMNSGHILEPKVKEGDLVTIPNYSGLGFKMDNVDLLTIKETDILGKLIED